MPSESEDARAVKKEPVKKEEQEEEDADDKSLSSILFARKKISTKTGALTPKSRPKVTQVKKEEPGEVDDNGDDDDDFGRPIRRKGSSGSRAKSIAAKGNKEENVAGVDDNRKPVSKKSYATKPDKDLSKKKEKQEEKKKKGSTTSEQNGKKKEKKIYDLPGQKRDPPEERDPLRIFYETLYKQVPHSDMAQIWMMESGLLPIEEAKKVYVKKQNRNQQKLSSPLKATTPSKRTHSETVRKSTPTSAAEKKTVDPKIASKQSKKRKIKDGSSDGDSDKDFSACVSKRKQRAS